MPKNCPVEIDGIPCETGQRIVMGKCVYHYRQEKAGVPFRFPKVQNPRGTGTARDELGRRTCLHCLQWKYPDEFSRNQAWCAACNVDAALLRRYGLTRQQVDEMVEIQGGCAICRRPDPGAAGQWHVDHDHSCCPKAPTCGKCVRGILCGKCNHLLGHADDQPDVLLAALNYLFVERKHKS